MLTVLKWKQLLASYSSYCFRTYIFWSYVNVARITVPTQQSHSKGENWWCQVSVHGIGKIALQARCLFTLVEDGMMFDSKAVLGSLGGTQWWHISYPSGVFIYMQINSQFLWSWHICWPLTKVSQLPCGQAQSVRWNWGILDRRQGDRWALWNSFLRGTPYEDVPGWTSN